MPSAERQVAVFLCGCGPNIVEAMDLRRVGAATASLAGVATVETYPILCSPEGQQWLAAQLPRYPEHAILIAGCSPREHLETFRRVCRQSGQNPYLLHMANLREGCAWVTPEREAATEKAVRLVRAAVRRAAHLEALEDQQVECCPDVLVVGAGIAGLQAAKLLANAERRVYLVERAPCIGGRAVRLNELYPDMACASCLLESMLDEILHHPRIEVLTCAELVKLAGSYGQFSATIRCAPRGVEPEACYGCPQCVEACPVAVPNEHEEGLAARHAIYVPYAGALPNVPVVDWAACLRSRGESCEACATACPFGAINLGQTETVVTRDVGAVVLATGAECTLPRELLSSIPGLSTSMMLERMLNSAGPTGGKVQLPDGRIPQTIALLHCAGGAEGGRSTSCSVICCLSMAKYTRALRAQLPEATIYELFWERCAPGKGNQPFIEAEHGIRQLRLDPDERVTFETARRRGRERVMLRFWRKRSEPARQALGADLVVLAPPLRAARGTAQLARVVGAALSAEGFLLEPQPRLAPYQTTVEGVLVAGCLSGPKDIRASAAEGAAAAARALSGLLPGRKLELTPYRASVSAEQCSGCKTCVVACPYGAISFDSGERVARVDERLCQGCGSCAARCPGGVGRAPGFTDEQLLAELTGLLE